MILMGWFKLLGIENGFICEVTGPYAFCIDNRLE